VEGHTGTLVKVTLEKVLHVPDMDSNLLSSNEMLAKGLEIQMYPTKGMNVFKDSRLITRTIQHSKLLRFKTINTDKANMTLKATGPKPSKLCMPAALVYDI